MKKNIKKYYKENGKLKYDYNFKNNKLHDIQYDYYKNGNLWHIENYKHDKQHGEQKRYYKNGELEYHWICNNGNREGIIIYYEI